jgi:hypothetical protein
VTESSTVAIARLPTAVGWGRWVPVLANLARLKAGEARKLVPRLTVAQIRSLRSAARWRHQGLHVRNAPGVTYVWLGGRVDGFEKYRGKKNLGRT